MKPYVFPERMPEHPDTRYMSPQQRRGAAKKRRKEVRKRRKADRAALREEWGF